MYPFTAKRLCNYTEKLDAITIPDYFKKRFRNKSNIILCIGAVFIQSIVMSLALLFVLGYGVYSAGGLGSVMENAKALPGFLNVSATYDNAANAAAPYGLFNKITMFCWGLGYFGMPHILLRFMAVRKAGELKLSRRIASIWVVFSLGIAVLFEEVKNM